jgi:hypothetical protein
MTEIAGTTFEERDVVLDDHAYTNCVFRRCRLVYGGGPLPVISGCELDSCAFRFTRAAANTIGFFAMLQGGFGRSGRQVVEHFISRITQTGTPQNVPPARK